MKDRNMTGSAGDAPLKIGLLGPLEMMGVDDHRLASASQRRLLSLLAIHAGQIVRSTSIEDELGLSPGALRTSVTRLRRVIGSDAVETTAGGYRLRADVDLASFLRLTALAPGLDDVAAREALEQAIRLWRGDPFAEFAGEPWTEQTLRSLHEQHAAAVEDLALLQLDNGEVANALDALRRLIDRDPYRERPRALLIRALVQDDRRTEALRAFQSFRTRLVEEIGTEPSSPLVELDRAIAASDETSVVGRLRPGHPAWTRVRRRDPTAPPARRHAPPVPVSSFVGRQDDLAVVLNLLRTQRLVTLTGAGGCGKTRLAIAAATAEHEDSTRTRWVELDVATTSAQVIEHVGAALGCTPLPGADPMRQLIDHLDLTPPTLLVLDNAEHVLIPVVQLVTAALSRCPAFRVLITSREPLGVAGEAVWRVPSLATPPSDVVGLDDLDRYDALRLFVERARSARPGLVVDDEALRHIASICIGLDGLPLAVEFAAARTRTQPVDVVASGINDAVRWQATTSRSPLRRHATLHASIAWSVDLIDRLARSVLTRLSVFQASFTLESAVAVASDDEPTGQVAAAIASLVDASLLQFDDATGRYRMLVTVRAFCALRAQRGDELDRARARHALHFANYCAEIGAGHRGIEREHFIREMPDVVAAMDWAKDHQPRFVFRMCAGLASVRSALGHHSNVADTWRWLLSTDRAHVDDDWSIEWATAVASQMAAATAHWLDVGVVADEVDRRLPLDAHRARGWLARGGAMLPAYHGRLGPILDYAQEVRERRDDLEFSIYGGFTAYMLALTGRLDEAVRQCDELARITRRHRTSFRVDTVGNGYAAAIIADTLRGDLRSATGRGDRDVPDDPAFSMTAAAALAHAADLSRDPRTLQRAVEWSHQRTIPLLRFLPTFIELVGRRFAGELDHAADLAEQYWEEAASVPVSQVHPLPILTSTLIDTHRVAPASAMVLQARLLVDAMDPAPLLDAGILASQALLAADAGVECAAASALRSLLRVTIAHGFVPMTVDALEQTTALLPVADSPASALRSVAARERVRMTGSAPTRARPASNGTPRLTLAEAVELADAWLSDIVAPPVPDHRPSADAKL